MSASPAVTGPLDAFVHAAPEDTDAAYHRLVGALWQGGEVTGLALSAVPALIDCLAEAPAPQQGRLAVLLGLLAEAEYPDTDGPVTAAVRKGVDRFLGLLDAAGDDTALTGALLYLLGHFPGDRERILAATERLALDEEDRTRLDRALQTLDPADPDLGRAWPSPAQWRLNDTERAFDRSWIRDLTPEQVEATWQADTHSVYAYSGAKAYWEVAGGTPGTVDDTSPLRDTAGAPGTAPAESAGFGPHTAAFRCPDCGGALDFGADAVRCVDCSARYPVVHGVLDLSRRLDEGFGADEDATEDVLQNAAVMKGIGFHYEEALRPAFLRVMGSNWGGQVSPADEDEYLRSSVPDGGPVLDLAAGAGRWTAVLEAKVGAEELIALDLNLAMLTGLRERLPQVPTVRASALQLPFEDGSLAAVSCWNALQAMPDAGAAIAEVGRCLRPGGTFTLLTFRWSDDPVYRYFQGAHRFPGSPNGIELFDLDEVKKWLADAGLTVRQEEGPGTFVFITAERTG
ncbi:class I SAM-dependent methyltransferase [Streptomyces sp. Da 82-17]|uniref:class I SAM-dependent methyltransferase n=1 Tax=Streptomyces sp. Da 82-17 TaxID=3377116 RepID=UPI0038D3ABC1